MNKPLTLKDIKEMQEDFLKSPRQAIIDLVDRYKKHSKDLPRMPFFNGRPDRLRLFLQIHKEYATLIGKLWHSRGVDFTLLRNNANDLAMTQKLEECDDAVLQFQNNSNATNASRLARAYASSCEIFWKKLKKIVFMDGLNPKEKHIDIGALACHLEKLEKMYSANLGEIRSFVKAKLRNSVGHEDFYFEPPNNIVLLDNRGGKPKEIERLTTNQVYASLVEISIVNIAMHDVENCGIISKVEPLLRLTDQELVDYCKTGKLSDSAKRKFDLKSAKTTSAPK